ncbi:MAG: hypothetical protein JXN62_11525 [Bacteroidales bacterium]|nr:hypothetical protein [Bacteroidales bacterium]
MAHAIKEIVTAVGHHEEKPEKVSRGDFKQLSVPKKSNKGKILTGSVILLALIILGFFFIPKLVAPKEELEKSIAVLPFINDSQDEENAGPRYHIKKTNQGRMHAVHVLDQKKVPVSVILFR